jgi:DNA (cytosine-5)-methyltransferase 1
MSCAAATRASHSPQRGNAKEQTMNATYGPTSRTQFAIYDPDTSSWKMWPDIGFWGSIEYSQTWPACGMTRNGAAYELQMSGRHTGGSESSSLLGTPQAHQGGPTARRRPSGEYNENYLERQIANLLPTPRAAQQETRNSNIYLRPHKPCNLENALADVPHVAAMLPTPRATDGMKGGPNQRGLSGDLMLPSAVTDL